MSAPRGFVAAVVLANLASATLVLLGSGVLR
jgi:hypothetical protein